MLSRIYHRAKLLFLNALTAFIERRLEDASVALAFLARKRRVAIAALDAAEAELLEDISGLHDRLERASAARNRVAGLLDRK